MTEPVRLVGVDLGQQRDYTAISITERILVPTGESYREPYYSEAYGGTLWRSTQEGKPEYQVRHLERPPLGTRYTEIVDRIVELVTQLGGRPVLAVDATGVGLPVIDMLRKRLREELKRTDTYVDQATITITGGDSVTKNPDGRPPRSQEGPDLRHARAAAERPAEDRRCPGAQRHPGKGASELPGEDQHLHGPRLLRGLARGRPRRPGALRGARLLGRGAVSQAQDASYGEAGRPLACNVLDGAVRPPGWAWRVLERVRESREIWEYGYTSRSCTHGFVGR
jgi:hypothetical protein